MGFSEDTLRELAALSGVVLAGHDELNDTLNEMCRVAVRALPAADAASLTSFSQEGPAAVAASDAWGLALDETQYVEHEGPCFDAARSGLTFRVRDTGNEPRWPFYMPRAKELGVGSMVSIPLAVESKTTGALNIYAKKVDAFDAEAVSIAEIIAAHVNLASQVAATLFGQKDVAAQLRAAMESRAVIEQAKGVIMATTGCDADAAFAILAQQSQHENRKLRDVARELVERYRGT